MNSHNVILVIHSTDEPLSFDSQPLTKEETHTINGIINQS